MKPDEALIYLPIDDESDAEDLYDEKLFELKQFFLGRFPISKVIKARLSKFEKIEEAFIALGGHVEVFQQQKVHVFPEFNSIFPLYRWYNIERNRIRLAISSARSKSQLSAVMEEYVNLTKYYATYWLLPEIDLTSVEIKVGAEPDPMDIQNELNTHGEETIIDPSYISSLPNDNCLKSEAKRLSLWLKFENDEHTVR